MLRFAWLSQVYKMLLIISMFITFDVINKNNNDDNLHKIHS